MRQAEMRPGSLNSDMCCEFGPSLMQAKPALSNTTSVGCILGDLLVLYGGTSEMFGYLQAIILQGVFMSHPKKADNPLKILPNTRIFEPWFFS